MDKFINVNKNPKGKKTPDCVVRALITALNKDVTEIIIGLTDIYVNKGWFINDPKCYNIYLEQNGYTKCPMPTKNNNTRRYTAEEFCEYLNGRKDVTGVVLAHVGAGHISTFVNVGTEENRDYRIYDSWNCGARCVGNWWKLA